MYILNTSRKSRILSDGEFRPPSADSHKIYTHFIFAKLFRLDVLS